MVARAELLQELEAGRDTTPITAIIRSTQPVTEATPLEEALEALQNTGASCLPVVRDGALVGLLTLEHLGKWLALREAVVGRAHLLQSRLPRRA